MSLPKFYSRRSNAKSSPVLRPRYAFPLKFFFEISQNGAFNKGLLTDELAEMRYQASIRPGFQESFAAMFPAPRQRWVDNLASREEDIRALPHETLVLHGREDEVIPLEASLKLAELIDRAQLHVFGRCGHWTQIEHAGRFARLVNDFFDEADKAASGDA